MRKYRLTLSFTMAAIVFTIIATTTENRVLIAVLFLVLLTFITVADDTIQRLRKRELTLVKNLSPDQKHTE